MDTGTRIKGRNLFRTLNKAGVEGPFPAGDVPMSIFVPEYTVLAIVLLIFGYHALKKPASDDGAKKKEAKKHQRMSENADKRRIGKTA
jgi:hypothetical protein